MCAPLNTSMAAQTMAKATNRPTIGSAMGTPDLTKMRETRTPMVTHTSDRVCFASACRTSLPSSFPRRVSNHTTKMLMPRVTIMTAKEVAVTSTLG